MTSYNYNMTLFGFHLIIFFTLVFVVWLAVFATANSEEKNEAHIHLNATISSEDLSSLSLEERTVIRNYVANRKLPITYGEFDSVMAKHRTALANADALESQMSALIADARCIGCGCDDNHSCDGGCYWVRLDRSIRLGVCSHCEPLSQEWDNGRRK